MAGGACVRLRCMRDAEDRAHGYGSQFADCGSQIEFLQIGRVVLASVPQCCDYARAHCRAK